MRSGIAIGHGLSYFWKRAAVGVCLAAVLVGVACTPVQEASNAFTYPEKANLGQDRCYLMVVYAQWTQGGLWDRSDKSVRVHISTPDRDRKILIDGPYRFAAVRGIESSATWTDFANPVVTIYETGPREDWQDEDTSGPQTLGAPQRVLATIRYHYDPASKTFKRVSVKK
jgi:hypothetical protein